MIAGNHIFCISRSKYEKLQKDALKRCISNALSAKKAVARHPDFVADNRVAHMSDPEFGKVLFVSLGDVTK